MMTSVSTSARSIGATNPFSTVNFSISGFLSPLAHVDEMPCDRGGSGHLGAHEVRAPSGALPAFEVAVRRRRRALAGLETVGVHRQAHRAARVTPLEPGVAEHAVQALLLGLRLDQPGPRHHHRKPDVRGDTPSAHYRSRRAQVLDARIRARADEYL